MIYPMNTKLKIYFFNELDYPINFLQELNSNEVELIHINDLSLNSLIALDSSCLLIVDFKNKKSINQEIIHLKKSIPELKIVLSTTFRNPLEQLKYIQLGYYNVIKRNNSLSLSILIEQEKQYLSQIKKLQNKDIINNSQEKFRLISENISDLITLHFPNESYLYISPSSYSLLGYKTIEMIIHSPIDFIFNDDKEYVKTVYNELRNTGKSIIFEYRMIKKSGEPVWVESSASNSDSHYGKNIILTTIRNIEERKKAQYEILQSLKKEKELNELKSKFVTTVSHEFRTPLTNINLAAEMLERYFDKLDQPSRLKYLNDIKKNCFRMTEMMEDILFLGKSEIKKIDFIPKTIDLKNFLEAIIYELEGLEEKQRIKLNYSIPPWMITIFDIKLIQTILSNLLQNALKYSPPNTNIEFNVEFKDEEFVFSIIDMGIGIPKDEIDKIFLPFQRASNAKDFFGTGLGMSIVKESVEIHKGKIICESEVGKGSKFIVQLPNFAHNSPSL
jgi:PAS domain S-box-containing protein